MSIRSLTRPIQAVASSSRSTLRYFCHTPIAFDPPKPAPKAKKAISSCPPGTVLTGLSVLKDQPDPVALPDDQYPAWLWTVLDDNKAKLDKGDKEGQVDFAMQKKRLRAQNRADIKASNYLKTT